MVSNDLIARILARLVGALAAGEFGEVARGDIGKRVSPEEMRTALADYPGRLTLPPGAAWQGFLRYPTDGSNDASVEFALWHDGAPSDLTLCLTVHANGDYTLEDLRVL